MTYRYSGGFMTSASLNAEISVFGGQCSPLPLCWRTVQWMFSGGYNLSVADDIWSSSGLAWTVAADLPCHPAAGPSVSCAVLRLLLPAPPPHFSPRRASCLPPPLRWVPPLCVCVYLISPGRHTTTMRRRPPRRVWLVVLLLHKGPEQE